MNLDKPNAVKVKFFGCTDDQARWAGCDDPRKYLEVGHWYEVSKVDVHSFHTKIYLTDYPGKGFNSVCFEEA